MLSHAKLKASKLGLSISWVLADCRDFNLGKNFDLIFIGFNSMQHLHDRKSIEDFFSCIRSHLAPSGKFIIDVFNPSIALLNRDPKKQFEVNEYRDAKGRSIELTESVRYDAATQVSHYKWHYRIDRRADAIVDDLQLRCFFPQELELLLHYNGFRIVEKFGSDDRSPFTSSSRQQILVLEKSQA